MLVVAVGITTTACAIAPGESPAVSAWRAHVAATKRAAATDGAPPTTSDGSSKPGDVLDLRFWKLTLPSGEPGKPTEVEWPALHTFVHDQFFFVDARTHGVVFRAPVGGVTTAHSRYPRSELREMAGGGVDKAAWSTTRGLHVLTVTEAVTHLPVAKPEVVAAQIHDATDDVVMVRLERDRLFVEADGKDVGTLQSEYRLGMPFTLRLEASRGHVRVYFDGTSAPAVDLERAASDCYFKAGAYTQSNPTRGDEPSAYGEVEILRLDVLHRDE